MHGLDLIGSTELDLTDTWRFQDTTTAITVSIHLHHLFIDGRVDDDPGTTTKFTIGWDVDKDGMAIGTESIDDLGTELEDLLFVG